MQEMWGVHFKDYVEVANPVSSNKRGAFWNCEKINCDFQELFASLLNL